MARTGIDDYPECLTERRARLTLRASNMTTYYYYRKTDDKWVETNEASARALEHSASLGTLESARLARVEEPKFAILMFTGLAYDVVAFELGEDHNSLIGRGVARFIGPGKPPKDKVEEVLLANGLTWFNALEHATEPVEAFDISMGYPEMPETAICPLCGTLHPFSKPCPKCFPWFTSL